MTRRWALDRCMIGYTSLAHHAVHRPPTQEPIMKYLLIPLALVAGSAFACPGAEGSKDAMASPTSDKAVVAKKATTKQVATVKAEKKVATKTASASPKVAGL
jgi:hypothetical protein